MRTIVTKSSPVGTAELDDYEVAALYAKPDSLVVRRDPLAWGPSRILLALHGEGAHAHRTKTKRDHDEDQGTEVEDVTDQHAEAKRRPDPAYAGGQAKPCQGRVPGRPARVKLMAANRKTNRLAQSTVSGIVDRLVARGMVVRDRDESDGRATVIAPSSAVRDFLANRMPELAISPPQKRTRCKRQRKGNRAPGDKETASFGRIWSCATVTVLYVME